MLPLILVLKLFFRLTKIFYRLLKNIPFRYIKAVDIFHPFTPFSSHISYTFRLESICDKVLTSSKQIPSVITQSKLKQLTFLSKSSRFFGTTITTQLIPRSNSLNKLKIFFPCSTIIVWVHFNIFLFLVSHSLMKAPFFCILINSQWIRKSSFFSTIFLIYFFVCLFLNCREK
jgi:hypothetical protein